MIRKELLETCKKKQHDVEVPDHCFLLIQLQYTFVSTLVVNYVFSLPHYARPASDLEYPNVRRHCMDVMVVIGR